MTEAPIHIFMSDIERFNTSKFPPVLLNLIQKYARLDFMPKLDLFFRQQSCPTCLENWRKYDRPNANALYRVIEGLWECESYYGATRESGRAEQCNIIRDIYGAPHRVDMWEGEHCQYCGRGFMDVWHVDDDTWKYVTEEEFHILCTACFALLKRAKENDKSFNMDYLNLGVPKYVEVDPTILTWNNGTIPNMAKAIYQSEKLDTIAIQVLADAIEESGFTRQDVLDHLREDRKHFHGCWVLDLLIKH